MAPSATSTSGHRKRGWYQLLPSKAMMNVARYSVSGTSHRSGTEATFWVMWLVTASSSTEPMAESASHQAKSARATGASSAAVGATLLARGVRQATTAHRNANASKSHDHTFTCWPALRKGSTTNG